MLFLSQQEVESVLDIKLLIDALAPAMVELSAGTLSMPQRSVTLVPEANGLLGLMPVYAPSSNLLSAKLVTVYPNNQKQDLPSHQAIIVLFDASSGTPLAVMDGAAITASRTAAGSALATRLLALPEAEVLLIVGTGVQARAHAAAISKVRAIKEIRIVALTHYQGQGFAQQISSELGIPTTYFPSFAEGAAGTHIVCAATDAAEPVVFGDDLEPGTHVNSVGLHAQGRELDAQTVLRSLVVVESRQAALAPGPGSANDLKWPISEGLITGDHIHAEIGELLSGKRPGRTSKEQITLYKSVGVAVQDAVAAQLVMDSAKAQEIGTEIQL